MLGDKIKELREIHKITQEGLANIMGLTRSTIYKYERNERYPDIGTITRMAEYFGVTIDYLCDRKPTAKEKLAYEIVAMFDRKGLALKDADSNTMKALLKVVSCVFDEYSSINKK
jgi:transcriptional regulator with XRE-family HTH domain